MWTLFIFATPKTDEVSAMDVFRLARLLGVSCAEPPCFPVAFGVPVDLHSPLIGGSKLDGNNENIGQSVLVRCVGGVSYVC